MNTVATTVLPNGLVVATDLAPFAVFVNGTVTSAIRYADHWNVFYTSPKGRRLTKRVAPDAVKS